MSLRPSDVQELGMWSDMQSSGIYLRDPVSLDRLNPNRHPQFFANQYVEEGIYWMRDHCMVDPTIDSPKPNSPPAIAVTALYSIQSARADLGHPGLYEEAVEGAHAVFFTRDGVQPDDGYLDRVMAATPASSLYYSGNQGSDGPVEAVIDEMNNKVENAWDEDAAMIGTLVLNNTVEWYQIGQTGLILRQMLRDDPLLRAEPGLHIAVSLHAEQTDSTRKMRELGLAVVKSQLLAPERMIPEYHDELYAAILSGCVIKPEHMSRE